MAEQSAIFGRSARLVESEDFATALREKPVARGEFVSLHMSPDLVGSARLGLIVPKRILRRATSRNATKRALRETFRLQRYDLKSGKYVFRLTKTPQALSLKKLKLLIRVDAEHLIAQCRELPQCRQS